MRLIDADAFIAEHCIGCRYEKEGYCTPDDTICGTIDMLRNDTITIEATPVVHGHWIEIRDRFDYCIGMKCSNCGRRVRNCGENFCPNCGAKMDGGEKDV